MKVVKTEILHVDAGWDVYSFLKLTTDEGLVGWSEYNESRGRRGLTTLVQSMADSLIGKDPRDVNRIEVDLSASGRSTAGGLQSHAIGAVTNACVDLKAKALGIPVYELLGGALRDRMRVYWSRCGVVRTRNATLFDGKLIDRPAVRSLADLTSAAREAKERGFTALKTNLLLFDDKGGRMYQPGSTKGAGHPELNVEKHLVRAFTDQLQALRDGAGDGVDLMVDLNFNYKPEGFRRFAKAAGARADPRLDLDADRVARGHSRQAGFEALSGSLQRGRCDHRCAVQRHSRVAADGDHVRRLRG